jgi:hypothetical protein
MIGIQQVLNKEASQNNAEMPVKLIVFGLIRLTAFS